MQSHLPEGLNPKMKSQLDEACGGPKALPVVPQQSVPPAQARGSNKQASMPRQGSGPPAHAKQKVRQSSPVEHVHQGHRCGLSTMCFLSLAWGSDEADQCGWQISGVSLGTKTTGSWLGMLWTVPCSA